MIAFIGSLLFIGVFVKTSSPRPGDIIIYGAGFLGSDVTASPEPGFPGRYRTRDGRVFDKAPGSDTLRQIR